MKRQDSNNDKRTANDSKANPNAMVTKGWIPKGEILEFAGRKIPGMVYFGNPEELDCSEQERQNFFSFFIDPTKPVAEKGGREFDKSLRSHDYGRMSPECRANYLDWLEGGKHDPNCSIHYPMLYCMSLEHRFFNAKPGEREEFEIFDEVEQLFGIYGGDSSIERVVANFPFDIVDRPSPDEHKEFYDSWHFKGVWFDPVEGFERNPEYLRYLKAIIECGEKSASGKRLDAHDIYPVLVTSPPDEFEYEVSEIPYFKDLFQIRLDQKYPDGFSFGIKNQKMADVLKSLKDESEFPFAWVACELTSDIDELFELADGVCERLQMHTDFIDEHPDKENCVEALLHLPTFLWEDVGRYWDDISGRYPDIIDWAKAMADQGIVTTVQKVKEELNLDMPFRTPDQLFGLNLKDVLQACGFGIAPDYFLRYRDECPDDPIMVYKLDSRASQLSPQDDSYVSAVIRISIGAYALHAENRSTEELADILTKMVIESEEFTNDQRKGLEANLKCILALPNDSEFIKRWRGGYITHCRENIPNFLEELANLDDKFQQKRGAIIKKITEKMDPDAKKALAYTHESIQL